MEDAQKSRVTLDHPDLGGRVRHDKAQQQTRPGRVIIGGGAPDSKLVARARLAREAQVARRIVTPKTKSQVVSHAKLPQKSQIKTSSEQAIEKNALKTTDMPIQSSESALSRKTKRFNFSSKLFNRTNVVYAMATILFVIGMAVSIQGYLSNRKANQQIAVLGEAVQSVRNGQPNSVASSLPNEDGVNVFDISKYQVAPNKPRYFRASSINIGTTRVLETSLTAEGAVETPAGIYDVSWYNGSAEITDEKGAVFVIGHYVGPHEAGIFWNLKKLNSGDEVEIEQGDGTISRFRVVERIDYNVNNVDMSKALAPVNPEKLGLNLMTCGGKWDVGSQQYDERTLVRTEKI